MKKLITFLLALTMLFSLAACGGGGSGDNPGGNDNPGGGGGSSNGTSIRLVNGKIEIDAQMKKLAEMYEKETGVHVEIESLGGGVDIQGTLKGYYQAANMPDIFVNGGAADYANWKGLLADLSGEAWVQDTDAAYKNEDGVVGFPYTIEAVGLAYNADLLDKAGIDPDTLTGPAKIEEAFAKLDGMKDELGITAVVGYYTEPVNLYWSTGDHLFANYIDGGMPRGDTTYVDMLNDGGKVDEARLAKFAEFVGILQKYSDPANMISGTYDQQIQNFASGKYVFVTQGSWIGATMTSNLKDEYAAAGNFKCGMIPYAFDESVDTILTNAPSSWAVYKDGNVEAAKAFLQWLTTEPAQEVLVKEAGFTSPFKSCTVEPTDPFAPVIAKYSNAGKTSSWTWMDKKEGMSQNATGVVFNDFAQGKMDAAKFAETLTQVIANYCAG